MTSKFNQMAKTDEEAVRKAVPMPVQKAKVIRAPDHPTEDGYHQVYVKTYYGQSRERAMVLTSKHGDVSVPEEGEDVILLFGAADKPIVLGSVYPTDDQYGEPNDNIPSYEEGDRIIGNGSGSYLAIRDDGTIEIMTDGFEAINIDRQSAIVHESSSQSIPGDDQFYLIEFDSIEDDQENLFDATTHSFTTLHDGAYEIDASLAFPTPGQNNRYTISVFVNGTQVKRKSRQSVVNEEMSLDISSDKQLDAGDEIDIRLQQDSGSAKSTEGTALTSDFTIRRDGI